MWELFNEPVYKCMCRGNAARFAERMKARYGTIARANAAWGTFFEDFALRGVPLDKSVFEGLPEEPSAKAGE